MKKIKLIAFLMCLSTSVSADTLEQALSKAYEYNPTLKSSIASVRAIDENIAIAKSGYRPTLNITGGYVDTKINSNLPDNPVDGYERALSANITQSVFSGFKTKNSVASAKSYYNAAISSLMNIEQSVLLNASVAYLNVMRDTAIVALQENNEKLLKQELKETTERFNVGELTRTDLSQAKASYESALSQLITARADLDSSKSIYRQVIGSEPNEIISPKDLDGSFPVSLEEALLVATDNNYSLQSAKDVLEARKYDVKTNTGDLLPSIDVYASAGRIKSQNYLYDINPTNNVVELGVSFTVPIYNAGSSRAKIRQSKYSKWQAQEDVLSQRDVLYSNITSYWGYLTANKAKIKSVKSQIKAYQIALDGVREEEKLGNRTLLEVLDQYQFLLNSEVDEVTTKHDYYLSGLGLLQTMGKLTAKDLKLDVEYFDIESKSGDWFSTSIDKN